MTTTMMTPDEFKEFYAQQAAVHAASALENGEVLPGEERQVGLLRAALACLGQSGAHDFPSAQDLQNSTPINGPEVPFTYENASDRSDFGSAAFHYEEGSATLTIFAFLPSDAPHDIQAMRAAYRRALAMAAVSIKSRESSYYTKNLLPLIKSGQLSERDVDALKMLGRDFLHRAFDKSESPRIAVILMTDDQMDPKNFKAVQRMGADTRKIFLSILSRFTLASPSLFDIRRLRREHAGEDTSAEANSVDFRDQDDSGNPLFGTGPIQCIGSPDAGDSRTYIGLMSAYALARIYEECGSPLFQKNIRSFLGVKKNKVFNKVRNTLTEEPEKFLAYNNGLSATARRVTVENGQIVALDGLQIVNGAQTTGTVANIRKAGAQGNAGRKEDADETLRRALVLFKVTEVSDKRHNLLVSRITMAANSQNTVSKGALDFTEKRWQFLPPFALELNHTLSLRGGDTEQLKRENDSRIQSGRVVERMEFAKWALVASNCPWLAVNTSLDSDYSTLWHHVFPETSSMSPHDDAPAPQGVSSFVAEALLVRMMSSRLNQDLINVGVIIKSQKKLLLPYMVTLALLWSMDNPEWMAGMRRALGGSSPSTKMPPAPRALLELLEEGYIEMMDYQEKTIEQYPTLAHFLRSAEGVREFISGWTSKHGLPEMVSATISGKPVKAPKQKTPAVLPPPSIIRKPYEAATIGEDDALWIDIEKVPHTTWDAMSASLSSKDRQTDVEVIEVLRKTSSELSVSQIRHLHKLVEQWNSQVHANSLMHSQ